MISISTTTTTTTRNSPALLGSTTNTQVKHHLDDSIELCKTIRTYFVDLREEDGGSSSKFIKERSKPGKHTTIIPAPPQTERRAALRKKRGKRVRFNRYYGMVSSSNSTSTNSQQQEEYALDEIKHDVWYTNQEYKAFREREMQVAKELSSQFSGHAFHTDGVESISYRKLRRKRIVESTSIVFLEQEACWDGGRCTTAGNTRADYIASAYASCSKMASMLAINRATYLEKQIQAMK
jgi:hypothetical protein